MGDEGEAGAHHLDRLVEVVGVHAVDDAVQVDRDPVRVAAQVLQGLEGALQRPRHPAQLLLDLGPRAVERDVNVLEPRLHDLLAEVRVREA